MGKFLIAGIIQKETIVKIEKLPVRYKKLTNCNETIFSDIGGDAYNEANALEWLGNEVRLLSLIGEEDEYLIDTLGLDSRYVLPVLKRTPAAVVFYDEHRKQQTFLDIKDLSEVSYEPELFEKAMEDVDMVILSNEEFCRPLLKKVKETMSLIQNNMFLKSILNGSNKTVKEFKSQKKSLKKLNKSLVKE